MASGYKEENRLTAPALSKRPARTNCHLNRGLCYDQCMKLRSALSAAAGIVLAVVAGITGFGQSAGPELKVGDAAPGIQPAGLGRQAPISSPITRARAPSCSPGSRKPSPVGEPPNASRSVRAAMPSGSSTSPTTRSASTTPRPTRSSPSTSKRTTRSSRIPSKEVANAYGVMGRMGFASRWTFYIGPDGKILYIDKAVKTSTRGTGCRGEAGRAGRREA